MNKTKPPTKRIKATILIQDRADGKGTDAMIAFDPDIKQLSDPDRAQAMMQSQAACLAALTFNFLNDLYMVFRHHPTMHENFVKTRKRSKRVSREAHRKNERIGNPVDNL